MDCYKVIVNEKDQFISQYTNHNHNLIQYYDFDPNKEESYAVRMAQSNNGREQQLAQIIRQYMSDLSLSEAQVYALDQLAQGAKVVIGGQQAGLLSGPLYTFHKVLSIIVKSEELSKIYDQPVVPVFWIAGEDHDFDEVNHTYVYNEESGQIKKVKFHTMTPPESSVSQYQPDTDALLNVIEAYFREIPETYYTKELIRELKEMVSHTTHWSTLFKQIIHRCFREQGILVIDASYPPLRALERPFMKTLLSNHMKVDQAFRQGQEKTTASGIPKMIETDTNVHLFLEIEGQRQLLHYENGGYTTTKFEGHYSKEALFDLIDEAPGRFSNNVVTRPLMQEWLFNTVAFVGGPSEIKYWAELHGVFQTLRIKMPIVLPRLRLTYVTPKTKKLLNQYKLNVREVIEKGATDAKDRFVRANASETVLNEINHMMESQQLFYEKLSQEMSHTVDNQNLLEKNHKIQSQQYEYLKQRYLRNIEKENDISMRHFHQLTSMLHPMGGLQERVLNPFQFLNIFGWDMYTSSTFPPLDYTFNQIVIET
ncbi:bacillithiol biosynthesis cysteine-adding enzyme BshC [Staphylococcus hyicus]|uniref:bacillithiol biosynthesis cysteine-adding enzyme BshC n=1 Tax=Staphylococcus hyicus TaxID=1284 RepID=UPI00211C8FFD|nr:bacillithiol biosynthesis cysteine-adding enzyme BshC [Staphylococcus hyicus]MCQ9301045.1 bacillithiol biosynthesis cysteine-adding enzyme BshC [Staphylococcus hyicus]